MGALITRLKIVSITSCVMSLVGLPLFIALKNGAFPTTQQLGLGGVALFGATGSTLALHFVFGPYILEMEQIPVRLCRVPKKEQMEDASSTGTIATKTSDNPSQEEETKKVTGDYLIKATTRSVFGMRKAVVFDPLTDITTYSGSRPFANFVAKNVTLYAHPELLEDQLRVQLMITKPRSIDDVPPPNRNKDEDELF
jgi:hypothetical protein